MFIRDFSDMEDLGRQLAFVGMTNIKVSERMISKKPRMEEWDGSVDEYLDKAIEKYSRKSLDADIMLLKLPKGVTNSAPSTERLVSCLTALAPYRKTAMKQREAEMKTEYADVIGYINYLAGCAARTSEEGRVFDMIHDFLNGDNSALGGLGSN